MSVSFEDLLRTARVEGLGFRLVGLRAEGLSSL